MNIKPFDPNGTDVQQAYARIMLAQPVKNLTEEEVLTTLRFLQLENSLRNPTHLDVYIHNHDERLMNLPETDKFLACLLEADHCGALLGFQRLELRFGGTDYQWRKIKNDCPIIVLKSATEFGRYGGRFCRKGWQIAPHIQTLRGWIYKNLKDVFPTRPKII